MCAKPAWAFYTEPYFALALILLYVLDGRNPIDLNRAAERLRIWNEEGEENAFTSFANCLALLILRSQRIQHAELWQILETHCRNARPTYSDVYNRPCGNNVYVLQVAAELLLRPLAIGMPVARSALAFAISQFERYRSPEGFYWDLPRAGADHRQFPPTYCMKFQFVLAICHLFCSDERIKTLFVEGMRQIVPLMTAAGGFSYFGRSDNTTFAVGLTIFCLKMAAALDPSNREHYLHLARRQERVYISTPRTRSEWLQVNYFRGSESNDECSWSRDGYTVPSEYSVASSAYVLLGDLFCPPATYQAPQAPAASSIQMMSSVDLGVTKLCRSTAEVFVRTSWSPRVRDRRYFGPTILHLGIGERRLIGAIPKTFSTDWGVTSMPDGRLRRHASLLWYRYARGLEHLNVLPVGYVPVIVHGSSACIPSAPKHATLNSGGLELEYDFVRVRFRGFRIALAHLMELLRDNLGIQTGDPICPEPMSAPGMILLRRIELGENSLRIQDTLRKDSGLQTVQFCVRCYPEAKVEVQGLDYQSEIRGWSSDGLATLRLYKGHCSAREMIYSVELTPSDASGNPS